VDLRQFHPWLDEQGQSSFVWSVTGAISQVTSLPITTAVTCPTTRIHPAIIAELFTGEQLAHHGMVSAPCGPDPEPYLWAIRAYQEAGFDEVYLGQVGGRLEGAFDFFATQVLPQARGAPAGDAGRAARTGGPSSGQGPARAAHVHRAAADLPAVTAA